MKHHKCPHCGERGMSAHKVLLAGMVGRRVKCSHCSKHGAHPGWAKAAVSVLTIAAVFALLACLVGDIGPVRCVLIAAALMAASAFLTRNVALLPVE